jgi:hypothetical protein
MASDKTRPTPSSTTPDPTIPSRGAGAYIAPIGAYGAHTPLPPLRRHISERILGSFLKESRDEAAVRRAVYIRLIYSLFALPAFCTQFALLTLPGPGHDVGRSVCPT